MKNLTIIFCAFLPFIAFSQGGGTINGSIVANLSVSSSGGVDYTVPINVPPGLNGIQPEISMDFDSHVGNGLAGWGWNVSGVSVITRIPSSKFHDNHIDPVDFDLDDRFALDGQRLILKNGTYGVAGSEYQTEQYSNLKIVAYGSNPISGVEGPAYFKVFYPDGSIGYYGNNANSRSHTDYAITLWENPQGIRISYEYQTSNNTLHIHKIKYGARGSTNPINEIEFLYGNRQFIESAYLGGIRFVRDKILTEIKVKGNAGTIFRRYTLEHVLSSLGYDRLQYIKEYNGDNSEYRQIYFTYYGDGYSSGGIHDPTLIRGNSNQSTQLGLSNIDQTTAKVVPFDFTGNGNMDFVVYPTTGTDYKKKLYLFTDLKDNMNSYAPVNTGFFEEIFPVNWLNDQNQLVSSQALGLIQKSVDNQIKFSVWGPGASSSGSAMAPRYTKTWTPPTYKPQNYHQSGSPDIYRVPLKYISGDFDGDGLSDIIALERKYTTTNCIEVPSSSDPSCTYKVVRDGVEYCLYGCSTSTNNATSSNAHLIKLDRRITTGFATPVGSLNEQIGATDKLLTIDVNGDGRTNIVQITSGKVIVYGLNKTNSYIVNLWETTDSRIDLDFPPLVGDYNGDGKGDILLPTGNNSNDFLMLFSKGTSFEKKDYLNQEFEYKHNDSVGDLRLGYNLIPVDMNGDGKTDIIEYNTRTWDGIDGKDSIRLHQIAVDGATSEYPVFVVSGSSLFSASTEQLQHYPIPIFLSSKQKNGNLEFAVISDKWVRSYKSIREHKEDVTLRKIINNGVNTTIKYDYVNTEYTDTSNPDFFKAYSAPSPYYSQTYPFVNINVAPSFKVVRELEQAGDGLTRKRRFYYEKAVSHANGLGFLGFEVMKQSNWYGDNVPAVWTISKYDPLLRGSITEQIVSYTNSSIPTSYMSKVNYFYDYKLIANPDSPIAPEYLENITRDNSLTNVQTDVAEQTITLEPGFHSIGGSTDYWGYIFPPEEQPGDAGYAGAVDIRLNKMETDNGLTGVFTTETYSYDQFNNPLVTTTSFPGGSKTITNQYLNNPTATNNTYHIGRLKKMTEKVVLNGNSFSTESQYAYNNNLVTQVKKKGNGTGWLTEDFTHDINGNVLTKTLSGDGVASRTEIYEYSSTYGERFLTKSTDIEGLVTTLTYDSVTGSMLSTTDPYGLTSTYEYDEWGRIKKEIDFLSNITNHTYTDLFGGVYQGTLQHDVDYPTGAKESTIYNAFGWTVQTGAMSLNSQWVYTDYEYYLDGKLKRESEPHHSSPSQWSTTVYGEYGRPISQTLATGRNISYTYSDPGLSYTVNDGSKTTTITMDALGNTIKVSNLGGTVDYTYHANGTMKTADHDGGNLISVGIDGWGRKTSLNDPSAGSYSYTYNAYGELLTETGPKGVTTYIYDDYGKIVSKTIEGDLTDLSLSYMYDPVTKLLTDIDGTDNTNSGRIYTYDYEYDAYERPDKIIENTGLASFEYEMVYDTYGRVEKEFQTSTFGGTSKIVKTKNVYDTASGLLKEIWSDSSTPEKLWELNSINARGQALTVTLGNGMVKNRTYDAYGYVTKIEDKESGTNPTVALHTEYDFNAQQGTLNSRENFGFGWEETFGYDNLKRLTSISGDVYHTMNYQSNGNISTNSSLGTYEYGDTSKKHRLTEIDPNPAGETYFQQHPTRQVSYNAFKKPVDIHQSGHGRVSFEYGPLMNRSTSYYGGEQSDRSQRRFKKHYSAIIPAEIVEDTQAGTTKFITYIGGDAYTAPLAHIKITGGGSTLNEYHYLHRDYLGSILAITDADGDVKEERQFGAWGKVDQFLDSGGGTTFGHNALLGRGYTGHEHFFEIGLIHMNGRMYDPQLGRFLSPDNYIQDPFNTQNYNRYGYVLNNPLMYVDPSGESFLGFLGKAAEGIGNFFGTVFVGIAQFFGWDGGSAYAPTTYENAAPSPSVDIGNLNMVSSAGINSSRPSRGGPGPWSRIADAWNNFKKSSLEFMLGNSVGHKMFIDNTINGIIKGLPALASSSLMANGLIVNGAFESGFDVHFDNGIAILEGILAPIDQGIRGTKQLLNGDYFGAGVNLAQTSDAIALAVATEGAGAGVNLASRGLSGVSRLSRTTRGLQRYVTRAAKEVDALGDAAFTAKQLQAIKRNPNLRPAFRGNRIDVRARQLIKKDSKFNNLKSNYSRGPDFVDPNNGTWWDITTPGAWERHVRKYGPGGILLKTQAK